MVADDDVEITNIYATIGCIRWISAY